MSGTGDIDSTSSSASPIAADEVKAASVVGGRSGARLLQRLLATQLIRSTATYAIADVINKGVPFILLPVIAHYLSTADYGVLANFNVLVQILLAFCALNTYTALNVSYFGVGKDGLPDLLSNLLYLIAGLTAVVLVITSAISPIITHYLALTRPWQLVALLTSSSMAVYTLYLSMLRMQGRAIRFGIVQIGQSMISSGLAIVFVVWLPWNWQGRTMSIAIASFVAMLFCLWSFARGEGLFTRINRQQLRANFTFGLPLLPHTMSFWIKTGLVKIIVTNAIGLSANGVYSIALTLGSIVGVFTDAFFSAYSPSMYRELSKMDATSDEEAALIARTLVRDTYRFAGVLMLVCVGGWFSMRIAIPLLFHGDYLRAINLMPLVFLALFFDGLYTITSVYAFYRRRTKVLGIITFTSAMVQVGLTSALVKPFGLLGALYAGCTVSLLTFIAVFIVANRLYSLPWRWFGVRQVSV